MRRDVQQLQLYPRTLEIAELILAGIGGPRYGMRATETQNTTSKPDLATELQMFAVSPSSARGERPRFRVAR